MNIPVFPGKRISWERKLAPSFNCLNEGLYKKGAFLDKLNGREAFLGKKVKN